MVEGHKGRLICGACLSRAYAQVCVREAGIVAPSHAACALCLMSKSGDYWQSESLVLEEAGEVRVDPLSPGALACRWCIDRSAQMLAKDAESGWKLPTE